MKKLLLIFCCLPCLANAQNFYFSARLGIAGYNGDLKSKPLSQNNFFKSIGAQYDLTEHFTARSYLSFTKLRADDKKANENMQLRNLNFQTKLWDWEVTAQYSIFSLNEKWWTPYAFAGLGLYHFNSYTKDPAGNKVYLQPLSTEGEGFLPGVPNYKRTQVMLPIGFGANYSLNEDMRLGIEFGYRKLFTDYLDDVSGKYVDQADLLHAKGQQSVDLAWRGDEINGTAYPPGGTARGSAASKDGYYYVAVTFIIRYWFDKYKQIAGIPGGQKEKKVGCPATRGY